MASFRFSLKFFVAVQARTGQGLGIIGHGLQWIRFLRTCMLIGGVAHSKRDAFLTAKIRRSPSCTVFCKLHFARNCTWAAVYTETCECAKRENRICDSRITLPAQHSMVSTKLQHSLGNTHSTHLASTHAARPNTILAKNMRCIVEYSCISATF